MGLLSLAGRFLNAQSNFIQSRKRSARARAKLASAVCEALETRQLLTVTLNESMSALPLPQSLVEGYADGVAMTLYFNTDQPTRQHKVVFSDTAGNQWADYPQTGSQFSGWFSQYYDDDAMVTATAMENVSGTWEAVWSQVWQVGNVAPSNAQLDFTTDGETGRVSITNFDDPSYDDWTTMRYSFANTYAELADHYSDASDSSYADFDVNEDEDGILWARLIDKNGGICDANTQYTLPTINFSSVAADSVTLNWNNEWGQDVFQWFVERAPFGGTFQPLDQVWDGSTSYTDTTVQQGTRYQYRVRPEFLQGGFGMWSAKQAVKTKLGAPTNVIAVADGSGSGNLVWIDNTSDETGFEVYKRENGGELQLIGTAAADATSFALSGLAQDVNYVFSVKAIGDQTDSALSAEAPLAQLSIACTALPVGGVITPTINYDDPAGLTIKLSFGANVSASLTQSDIRLTEVYSNAAVDFVMSGYNYANNSVTLSFASPTTFLPQGFYQLRILGSDVLDGNGFAMQDLNRKFSVLGGDANHDGITDIRDLSILAAHWHVPGAWSWADGDFDHDHDVDAADLGIFSLHWQQSVTTVLNVWASQPEIAELSWDDKVNGEARWMVQWCTDGSSFNRSQYADQPQFELGNLTPGATYYFRVYAVDENDQPLMYLPIESVTMPLRTPTPGAVVVTPTSPQTFALDWPDQAGVKFNVYRDSQLIASGLDDSEFSDPKLLPPRSTVHYSVTATAVGQFESTPSDADAAYTPPNVATGLETYVVGANDVKLFWDNESNVGYRVYRGSSPDFVPDVVRGSNRVIGWEGDGYIGVAGSTVEWDDTTADADTQYYYKVVASMAGLSDSAPTLPVAADTTALTVPPAPGPARVTLDVREDSFDVVITWADTSRLNSPFTVYRSRNGGAWTPLATTSAATLAIHCGLDAISPDELSAGSSDIFDLESSLDGSNDSYAVTTSNGAAESDLSSVDTESTVTMGGSSAGRPINQVPNPGNWETPTAIYHINDRNFGSVGHSGVIIPDENGCTYYSYSMDGKVKSLNFHNIHDALKAAKATNYTREEHWSCTEEQAEAARKAAMKFNNTKYDTLSHNCWDMVCAAVNAAGGNCVRYSEIPNRSFDFNEDLSDGVSTADSWGD